MTRSAFALLLLPFLFAPAFCIRCRADVTLPAIISDNMVLEQHEKIGLWGKADPGESVTVQIGPNSGQTVADKDGAWALKLDGLKSGGPYDMTVSGKNSITVHNIAVGDVWVAAGESNMEFNVLEAANGQQETADANLPMIRVFVVKHSAAEKPQRDCEGTWVVCDPDTVRNFSAIGFFFSRELNRGMRLPIGLIQATWGPSPAQAWTPRETLDKNPALQPLMERYDKAAAAYPEALSDYQARLTGWRTVAAAAKAAGSAVPHAPMQPLAPGGPREPSALFNGMISPLLRYPIRGVLWDQGESNTSDPVLYRTLFPVMIGAWRKAWGEDFPFLYVQLSGFLERHAQPVASRWAELREAQASALSLPKTGMAVTIDLGHPHDMHPADKQDVAHRLLLIAEKEAYGKTGVVDSGPVFSSMSLQDGKAALSFSHDDGGLVAKDGPPLKGFAIAGDDRVFVWADAEIQKERVIVSSRDVPKPAAVRYAWADFPDCGLFNKAALPAAPFRTDDWIPGEPAAPAASPMPARTRKHHAEE